MYGTFATATNEENALAEQTSGSTGVEWKTERLADRNGKTVSSIPR
jgi:hypothetical protein